jgi:spore coat-associated protein N
MADDKSPLTRRRVLGGMATVGVAGALGATTWAEYTDTETVSGSASAGTFDLTVGETSVTSFPFSIGSVAPGDGVDPDDREEEFTLENVGNTDAEKLTAVLSKSSSGEGNNSGDESNSDDQGELDDHLELRMHLDGDLIFDWTDLSDLYGASNSITGSPVVESDTGYMHLQYRLPSDTGNDVKGDTVEFDIELTLEQNA